MMLCSNKLHNNVGINTHTNETRRERGKVNIRSFYQ
jgi:hypothetical protein